MKVVSNESKEGLETLGRCKAGLKCEEKGVVSCRASEVVTGRASGHSKLDRTVRSDDFGGVLKLTR